MGQQEFEQVVEKHADFVYNVAYRMLSNPDDAQEAAQDAFLSAFRAWARFRGQSEITTWLYRITVNACLMKLRKEKKARTLTQTGYEDQEIPDWAENPERAALNTELKERLEGGIALLASDLRAAVVLRDVQGLSNEEAAAALKISVSALKARLHRARVLLRKHLDGYVRATR